MFRKMFSCMVMYFLLAVFTTVSLPQASYAADRQNDCPIILVHAWLAWGRGQMLGFNAWGGDRCDLQEDLKDAGYETYTVSMGPYSSTWDRACELYAQIKGGTVDYGLAHSRKYGHARFGRTYPGYFPEWGQIDPATGKTNKVHVIGHCFGGITCRYFIQLLEGGFTEEVAATPASKLSPLFSGGHSWVLSCTTLSTPHDGTSLLDQVLISGIQNTDTLRTICLMFAPTFDEGTIYDLQLDQWGFYPQEGETMHDVMTRLGSSAFWKNNKDFSNWDITPTGIYTINTWVKAWPDVYYFSQANQATYKDILGHSQPILSMIPVWYPFAQYMGDHTRKTAPYPVDSTWWPNDGTVNVVSMSGPKVGSTDQIVNFTGVAQIGKWNFLGVLKGVDHFDIVGLSFGWMPSFEPSPWFMNHAGLLGSLPNE